ncbi:MAG: sensor histidine kinase, partial [Bacteroidales bacterium]
EATWRDIAKQIAHEIKNPLTPMKLNIQYLLKIKNEQGKVSDEILKNTMHSLLEQIDSLSTIATAFSTFANLPKPHFEQINLNDIITKTAILFQSPDCFIETFLPPYPCFINGDKEYIKRILTNLITNAIQAIPSERKKKISISLEHKYTLAIISISDNGIGISPEIEDKIFKPSFTTKSSGMGMGLSLVKNMVEAMNGKIFFTTTLNVGTTFYVEFSCINTSYESTNH